MSVRIKPFPDLNDSTQVVRLDGRDYQVRMVWQSKVGQWRVSVATWPDLRPVITGVHVRNLQRVFRWADPALLPGGELLAVDYDENGGPIARSDWGDRLDLVYFTADELAELQPDVDDPFAAALVELAP